MNRKQAGFTLIELVMVIVILGILAAFAIPRFANLGTEARVSAVQGVGSSIKSAAAIAHSAALVQNKPMSGASSVDLEGQTINLVNGYPTNADIWLAAQFDANGYTLTGNRYEKDGAANSVNCSIEYAQPAAANSAPTISVLTSLTDC